MTDRTPLTEKATRDLLQTVETAARRAEDAAGKVQHLDRTLASAERAEAAARRAEAAALNAEKPALERIEELTARAEKAQKGAEEAQRQAKEFAAATKTGWFVALLELVKYPVLLLTVFILLATVGVPWENLTELGINGLKFESRTLATKIDQQQKALSALEEQFKVLAKNNVVANPTNPPNTDPAVKDALVKAQEIASDDTVTANTAALYQDTDRSRRLLLANTTGYIWIGDKRKDEKWKRLMLKNEQGNFVNCDDVQVDQEYTVARNPVLRDARPDNTAGYFRSVGINGVVPSGSKVRVLSEPVGIDREFAVQYWVQVQVISSSN